ncbi:MAG: hypothetical protein WA446_09500 [Steroidobacteraceae bacterium]
MDHRIGLNGSTQARDDAVRVRRADACPFELAGAGELTGGIKIAAPPWLRLEPRAQTFYLLLQLRGVIFSC